MAAALSWEFPMPTPDLDRRLKQYLDDQEEEKLRRPSVEKRIEQLTDTVLREIQGLKTTVDNEFRGVKARIQIVEQRTEQLTTDSGSWDIQKLKTEMELAMTRKELEAEKNKPKGILAEYGPKILTHVISVVLTAVITYAVYAATHGAH